MRRVAEALAPTGVAHEILFIDDGSRDRTPEKLADLHKAEPERVRTIRFTRSFGHQAALVAGLRHARGDAVVTMDGDLQHPPEFLPTLIEAWRDGADVVHTVRRLPPGAQHGAKERAARIFYRLMSALTSVPVIPASADFRLVDRSAVDAFNQLEERFIFARGLIPWLGFKDTRVTYQVEPRFAGQSKYGLWPMIRLALDGIFSFSVMPLRLISLLGALTTVFGVAFGVFALIAHLTGRVAASGWTSVVVLILIFGGVQLLSVGILSEYVGRVYAEVKRRPRYVIESRDESDSP